MNDLYLAAAIVAIVSLMAGWGGWRVAKSGSKIVTGTAVVLVMALTGWFVIFVQGTLTLARFLPFGNLVVLGNAIPVCIGFLGGVMLRQNHVPKSRRGFLFLVLLGIAAFALLRPMFPDAPKSANRWAKGDVCLQSNSTSCSAAAGATILRHHGIASDEREMTALCLTTKTGTTALGLYRGLKLKTAEADVAVEVIDSDVDSLLEENRWPVLLLVKLEPGANVDPRYEKEWGWTPGVGHAVVLFGRVGDDRLDIGDPAVGREQWMLDDLRVLWQGRGLRLVPTSQ